MDRTSQIRFITYSIVELSMLACPGVAVNQLTKILPGENDDAKIKLTQILVSIVGLSLGIACFIGGLIYRYFGQKIRILAHGLQVELYLFI